MLTALLTAFNKEGTVPFALGLNELGYQLLASEGTAAHLKKHNIEVTDVATIVGEPILDHRVVTLSREIHAGLLAQNTPEDRAELVRLGIPWIAVVYVDLYPIEAAIGTGSIVSVTKFTDIGGPAILRSAAKGRRLVVCNKDQLPVALSKLHDRRAGKLTRERWDAYLLECASEAELCVARYAGASGAFLRDRYMTAYLHN